MNIELTRGDTLKLSFIRKDSEGEIILTTPEHLYFSVKNGNYDENVIFQKTLDDMSFNESAGKYTFYINSVDTDNLEYGKYKYDIEVKDSIDGIAYTKTIAMGDFIVKEEVTFVSNEV